MGVDAGTPPGLLDRIRQIAAEEVRKFARSGFLRNASISDGGLTIKGGFFRLLSQVTGGVEQFYLGPIGDVLGNGERQQFWRVRRADGSTAVELWDAFPDPDGTLNQALTLRDRSGNAVIADDTDSGFGLARPYIPGVFYRTRWNDWPSSTAGSWETLYRAKLPKQQPRLRVAAFLGAPPGTTGQMRVMVNGSQLGSVIINSTGAINEYAFGPDVVAGAQMDELVVELQVHRSAGTGDVRACPSRMDGWQS